MDVQIGGLGGLFCDLMIVVVLDFDEEIDVSILCEQIIVLIKVIGCEEMLFCVLFVLEYGIDKVDVVFMFDVFGLMNSLNCLINLKVVVIEVIDVLLLDGVLLELIEDICLVMMFYNSMVDVGLFFEDVIGVMLMWIYMYEIFGEYDFSDIMVGSMFGDLYIGFYDIDIQDLIFEFGDDVLVLVEDWMDDDLIIVVILEFGYLFYGMVESVYL